MLGGRVTRGGNGGHDPHSLYTSMELPKLLKCRLKKRKIHSLMLFSKKVV